MFETLPMAPPDPILGLTDAFKKDPNPNKINLGVGVFQDEDGKTTTLASVRRAEALLLAQGAPKTYLPIEGSADYGTNVRTLLFGAQDVRVRDGRAVTAQSPGGTGALRVAADLARGKLGLKRIWVSDPTWANHQAIFQAGGLETVNYPYYDPETKGLAFDKLLATLSRAGGGHRAAGQRAALHAPVRLCLPGLWRRHRGRRPAGAHVCRARHRAHRL